jgi:hypothetical protein
LDPPVEIDGTTRHPDLKLSNPNGDVVYVELTRLAHSKSSTDAMETLQSITWQLMGRTSLVDFAGQVFKTLSTPHRRQVVQKVRQVAERVDADGRFRELSMPGVLQLGIAPQGDREMLEQWAGVHGFEVGQFAGPPYHSDEVARIKHRLQRKQAQLPGHYPGLVLIDAPSFHLMGGSLEAAVQELEEPLFERQHLVALVVSGTHMGGEESASRTIGINRHVRRRVADMFVEDHLVLLNRFCRVRVMPETTTKALAALADP